MLVDSHAHLQWTSFDIDRQAVIERAMMAGVEKIITIGFDLEGSKKGIKLADENPHIYATVGIHPHNAQHFSQETLYRLRQMAEDASVVAIGEIGLDYYRKLSSKEDQQRAFKAQLLLAEELQLPVVIHDREAHKEILDTLSEFRNKLKCIMHCFSGSKEMAAKCIDMGFYISFAGTVTFPNARRLQEIASWIDVNKIMLETDCPWLAPQRVRGKRNEPVFLTHIGEVIASLKGLSLKEIAAITTKNAHDVFKLS